jgi:UDP-N-acetylmuramoyl-tripeptide--D-alanyl-D-alanine ligase
MEAIRRAKYELIESLPANGTAVMNTDDLEVRALADATKRVEVWRYGLEEAGRPDVTARAVKVTASGTTMEVSSGGESIATNVRMLGRHAIGHVLAAVAVALASGGKLKETADAIARLTPVDHRLQLLEGTGGVVVIDDAYNSNPDGAEAALEVLEAMPGRRKIVVTPGIIELGAMQRRANERFGERAGRVADAVVVVARANRDAIVSGAERGGRADVLVVDSLSEAQEKLKELLRRGDVVLFENDLPDQYEG